MIMMQPETKSERKSRTRQDGAQKSIVAMHRLILPCNDGRRLTSLRERLDRFEASVRPLYEESFVQRQWRTPIKSHLRWLTSLENFRRQYSSALCCRLVVE
jgi:hypothetical protein